MSQSFGGIHGEVSLDYRKFQQGVTAVNRNMRVLKSEFDAGSAKAKAFGGAQQQLKFKSKSLGKQIALQRQKVDMLTRAHEKYVREVGRDAKQTQQLEVQLNKSRASLSRMEGSLKKVNSDLAQHTSKISKLGKGWAKAKGYSLEAGAAMTAMSAGIAVALGSAVKKAADFESQLSGIKAVTGASAGEMEKFRQLALDMGAETKYSASEAARAIEEMAKAGISAEKIMGGGLAGALDLAAAGELELAEAAEIAATALNAFKSDQLSVSKAADILAGAANASATSVSEMNQGLSQVAAVASGAGLSFEDTSTALATFAQNGLKGSDAGTSLKTMLLNLTPSSKEAKEQMKELGIVTREGKNIFYDTNGEIKSFADISEVLSEHLSDLSKEQRNAALKTMFGTDAIRAANIAFKEGSKGIEKMNKEMGKTTAAEVAAERMNNLNGTLEELKSAFETAQIEIGTAFLPVLKGLAEGLKGVVEWFSDLNPQTKESIAIFAAVTAGFLAVGAAIAGIIAVANPLTAALAGAAVLLGGMVAVNREASKELDKTRESARRFGEGVSEETMKAARGYVDLRDAALVNLNKLRISSREQATKIVDETVKIFAKMGDKIVKALEEDKIAIQTMVANLLGEVPDTLKPTVDFIGDSVTKSVDQMIRNVEEASEIIRRGLLEYGGDMTKMPAELAKAYQTALLTMDESGRAFAKKVEDIYGLMGKIQSEQGKITADGAKKWSGEIEKAYQDAVDAATDWATEMKKKLDTNSELTKAEYDASLEIIKQVEKDKKQVALQAKADSLEVLGESLSEEAQMYDLHGQEMAEKNKRNYLGYEETEAQLRERTKKSNEEYIQSVKEQADKAAKEVEEGWSALEAKYGQLGRESMEALTKSLQEGGVKARLVAESLGVQTKEGMRIDLGSEGEISINSFLEGLESGEYDSRDIAVAHMSQLRTIYGEGDFTEEGIRAIESFTEGLKGKDITAIAKEVGLDLESEMEINLGPYGKVTAESFALGLINGKYSFDAVYAYFRNQLQLGMTFDLSKEGRQNIETLRLGMQSKAIDVQEASRLMGLDIESGVKVDLGTKGKHSVQTLLQGLQSGKIDIKTFMDGVGHLLEKGAVVDLTGQGKRTGDSMTDGLSRSKNRLLEEAGELSNSVSKRLSSTTDGGGGKKTGANMALGIRSRNPMVRKEAYGISQTVSSTMGKTTDGGGGSNASGQFNKGILRGRVGAGNAASSVSQAARRNLKVSGAHGLGTDVASGFAGGIRSGKYGVIRAAASLATAAWSAIRSNMAIRSPSRKTMELGMFTAQGYEEGMKQRISEVARMGHLLAEASVPSGIPGRVGGLQSTPLSSTGSTTNITRNYYIHIEAGANHSMGDKVVEAIKRYESLHG
ncbi:phage tail tape measure protein [Mechercharimyces sp. CAU 1602]|uniref:phage tail tape measure protein n=1 Tax=Mechercharimyces sp. CAU 1602 TaxID=2973933 RepID=UPI002162AF8C|nr:phage tail tape measure protein [Mechercharimyces sp. CAU 1602]MCS1351144.1 phage tail tape measure protein [Mechercharimyces sp. CAU 1602]